MRPDLSRRALLQAAALLPAAPALAADGPVIKLRLLETSDLHSFVEDYDYFRDQPDESVGLTKIATLAAAARAGARNSMLFDNGDIIQGNPLADYVAQPGNFPADGIHPTIRAMNTMGYDAATLGNHEFNYGLDLLRKSLAGANFPFCSANYLHEDGTPCLPPTLLLTRRFTAEDGSRHTLKIGVIGFLPPQITHWDRDHLAGQARSRDIVEAAAAYLPALRAEADLVIALSHSGISAAPRQGGEENASLHLATVPGIDVIFTGHSHRTFPGPDYAGLDGVDATLGTLHGIPAVMPGFWGGELGQIDLTLTQAGGKWVVSDFTCATLPIAERQDHTVTSLAANNAAVDKAVAPEHQKTLAWIREPIGQLAQPVNSYLALVNGADSSLALVNAAQLWYATPLLPAALRGLPVLSAAAPFKEGYQSPENYVDLPAGGIAIKDVADLYSYPNTVAAVRVNGAALREWLERSAGIFSRIDPANPAPQALLRPRVPSYIFDVMAGGVTYEIDLTQPARYGAHGLAHPAARRIVNLRYQGEMVTDDQVFVVVTNNYRAESGGIVRDPADIVLHAPDKTQDVLVRYILAQSPLRVATPEIWRFAPLGAPVTAIFESAPEAAKALLALGNISLQGDAGDGYASYAMQLS
ncbi:bifunctional 2',3'-cyclic-nucleotide 2'-phosphodiesterase/3'-nucleotidase [Acidocella sp. KAb 2-4]|uniref:bifunctional 2',3'-cyclic-nucleotide 2'-phosphodiesterase/3'-nucleotidase n=1 Tax=Acidocella sp. KAb 2-4 TaxID=2885158 RepID=UPI001D081956|nr:bifunctional 2',3'-cyclic-nucleotide 2'-phosphodiesterase/3'-nucleotidase [Acidocella sp. KAb 2-4]MCB5945004.1 bifunctional 2',3'-cyclic-nucleotide 2'-phosphodiesterase/3'-nucleotidase [Acidocella sp. KAb 2-4]